MFEELFVTWGYVYNITLCKKKRCKQCAEYDFNFGEKYFQNEKGLKEKHQKNFFTLLPVGIYFLTHLSRLHITKSFNFSNFLDVK